MAMCGGAAPPYRPGFLNRPHELRGELMLLVGLSLCLTRHGPTNFLNGGLTENIPTHNLARNAVDMFGIAWQACA